MARAVERWFICTGPYRIHSVKPVEGHTERIIEIEDVDRHERFMDLERLAFLFVRACARDVSPPGG